MAQTESTTEHLGQAPFTLEAFRRLRPVFIVGAPKSGTSLLVSLFDGHPDALALHTTAAYRLTHTAGPLESVVKDFYARVGRITGSYQVTVTFPKLAAQEVAETLKSMGDGTGAQALSRGGMTLAAIVAAIAARQERTPSWTWLVEKTPDHYLYMDHILRDLPNAKVIHIIRDPRGLYATTKLGAERLARNLERPFWAFPVPYLAHRILHSMEHAYRLAGRYPQNYGILFYEDLVTMGEEAVRAIAAWLGLPWSDRLLEPTLRGKPWGGNSNDPALHSVMQPFDPRAMGRWRTSLSRRELAICEAIIRRYGLQDRYPLTLRHPNLLAAATLAAPYPQEAWLEMRAWRKRFVIERPYRHGVANVLRRYVGSRVRLAGALRRVDRETVARARARFLIGH